MKLELNWNCTGILHHSLKRLRLFILEFEKYTKKLFCTLPNHLLTLESLLLTISNKTSIRALLYKNNDILI